MTLAETDRPAASPPATRKRPMQLDTDAEDSAVRRVYDMTLDSSTHPDDHDKNMSPADATAAAAHSAAVATAAVIAGSAAGPNDSAASPPFSKRVRSTASSAHPPHRIHHPYHTHLDDHGLHDPTHANDNVHMNESEPDQEIEAASATPVGNGGIVDSAGAGGLSVTNIANLVNSVPFNVTVPQLPGHAQHLNLANLSTLNHPHHLQPSAPSNHHLLSSSYGVSPAHDRIHDDVHEDKGRDNDHVVIDRVHGLPPMPHEVPPYSHLLRGTTFQDDSDAGSSSCKDVEDPGILEPDSVPAMVAELRKLLDYVASKPTLQCGSASFMRDYLRTMLIQSAQAAREAVAAASRSAKETDRMTGITSSDLGITSNHPSFFRAIPDELAKHIFSFLEGKNLAVAREVCTKWNEFACEEHLWKDLCLKRWRSLETDKDVWPLIDKNGVHESPHPWRKIYPVVNSRPQWPCRLQKTGRFICNLIAHQISGTPLGANGLPHILVVERRFNILHLQTFVLPDASVLYFEPETENDRAGFKDFIDYLHKRTRAGLALEDQRRFIFIPPCDYTKTQVGYNGSSLLGVVQNAYPPLAP